MGRFHTVEDGQQSMVDNSQQTSNMGVAGLSGEVSENGGRSGKMVSLADANEFPDRAGKNVSVGKGDGADSWTLVAGALAAWSRKSGRGMAEGSVIPIRTFPPRHRPPK